MIKKFFARLMDVPTMDPDDARSKKLLNTLLVYMGLATIIILVATLGSLVFGVYKFKDVQLLLYIILAFIVLDVAIYMLNKRSGKTASWIFLAIFTIVLAFSDTPQQIGNGSSEFVFALPIATAALLISPPAGFIFALLSGVIVTFLGITNHFIPNIPTIISFFLLALVSWLSASGLEKALKDLRAINKNLDRLVQERTQELALSLSRERVEAGQSKAILESIADAVIVFDLKDRAIIANPSSLQLLEIPSESLLGASIEQLSQSRALAPESRATLAGILSTPGAQMASHHIEWGHRTFSVTAAPVNDTQGELIGTVAVFRDYTHEAEVERMKNTFLAIVSHELRTPLNAILGYAEMIKEAIYGPVNEKQARASDRIMTNSHRLLDIVSDLLDQAQMEAGKLALHIRPFRPADLVENVHGVMDKIAIDKGLGLTSELDPELPVFLDGDIARLQQILVNLINNAIKFTDQGSVHMYLKRSGENAWAMEVRDTGIGIPESDLPTIFEAFRQVDSTVTRKYGGFGLGLTIVKQLTELMGGSVNVTSKLTVGSSFEVILPLLQAERGAK